MTERELSLACFTAIFSEKVQPPRQWDLAAAVKLRTAMLALPDQPISPSITVDAIYHAVLPMFDIKTTDDDECMPAFHPPTMEELNEGLAEERAVKSGASKGEKKMEKVFLKKVEGYYDEEGLFTPTVIYLTDELHYMIDKVKERRPGHSAAGGIGLRYLCDIITRNRTHHRVLVHDEKSRWFVEAMK